MATSFYHKNKLYLFSPNGLFTCKSLTTPDSPSYIGFDSQGRFIQISINKSVLTIKREINLQIDLFLNYSE